MQNGLKPNEYVRSCEICNALMTVEEYEYCDICGDCLE